MLRIYTPLQMGRANAQQYYRQILPLAWMEKLYDVRVFRDNLDLEFTPKARFETMATSDVAFLFHAWTPWLHEMVKGTFQIKPARDGQGDFRYPPAVVTTFDDNVWALDPLNPAYSFYGGLNDDGTYMDPDAVVEVRDGDEVLALWHGVPIPHKTIPDAIVNPNIDFTYTAQNHARISEQVRMSQAIIVPRPQLADAIIRRYGPAIRQRIHIIPNMCDLSQFRPGPLREDDTVRIGMSNTVARLYDLKEIIAPLKRVMERFDNTVYVHFGSTDALPEWVDLPRVEMVPWTDWRAWPVQLTLQRCDIMLAPMFDTPFNVCRSNSKLFDAAGPVRPAALLAPRVGVYADEIIDGETGLLYDTPEQFEEQLVKLVEDARKRKEIAQNGRAWVGEHRSPEKLVPELWKVLRLAQELRRDVPVRDD